MNRHLFRIFAGAFFWGSSFLPVHAEDAAHEPATNGKTFTHIPLEDRDVLENLVQNAVNDFQAEKYDDALEKLNQARRMESRAPMILNLLGAIYTKQKEYDKAEKEFLDCLSLDPRFFPAKFNLGEIKFLRKDYPEALSYFKMMKLDYPQEELLDFKIVLSQLMLDQKDDAERSIDKMRFPGNSPAWYYANGAFHLKTGAKSEGMDYIDTARKIFSSQTSIYDESLEDAGLLKKSS